MIRKWSRPLEVLARVVLGVVGVEADLLVVLLEGSHVLAGLGELALLHTLAHVPEGGDEQGLGGRGYGKSLDTPVKESHGHTRASIGRELTSARRRAWRT